MIGKGKLFYLYSKHLLSACGVLCLVAQSCPTLCKPMNCSPPGSSVHGIFFRQEYWSGLPFPPPGNLPDPEFEPTSHMSPALQADYLPPEPPGKPLFQVKDTQRLKVRR